MSAVVESVETSAYTVPTDAPEADGTLAWDATSLVLVQVGCVGVVGTGWTYGAVACSAVVRDVLAPVVCGLGALDVTGAWTVMVAALRNLGRPGIGGMALLAVDPAHGLEVSGHCAPHAHAALRAAVPNLRHLEWFHDHVRIESMLDGVLDPAGGAVRPDGQAAGHGLTWRADAAERWRVT